MHLGDREDYDSTTSKKRAWGSSGSHIVIYVPQVQQRKAQVLAALRVCILLRYTLLPSGRLTPSRALSRCPYTVPWTRGWWSRPTDRPSGGTRVGTLLRTERRAVFSSLK